MCTAHNYKWQNGKECKGKTIYAQCALAQRVRQNFWAEGRLTSSPPPPSLHPLAQPQTTPIGLGIGRVGGCARGCRGGREGELVNLQYGKTSFSATMLIWDEDDICAVVFHSVIYNSVVHCIVWSDFLREKIGHLLSVPNCCRIPISGFKVADFWGARPKQICL